MSKRRRERRSEGSIPTKKVYQVQRVMREEADGGQRLALTPPWLSPTMAADDLSEFLGRCEDGYYRAVLYVEDCKTGEAMLDMQRPARWFLAVDGEVTETDEKAVEQAVAESSVNLNGDQAEEGLPAEMIDGCPVLSVKAGDFVGENLVEGIEKLLNGAAISIDLSDKEGTKKMIRSMDAMTEARRQPPSCDDIS